MPNIVPARPYKRPPTLVPETPLTIARALPGHHGAPRTVDISIYPDLRVAVHDPASHTVLLRGRYDHGVVTWHFVGPTLHTERALVANDVRQLLRAFETHLLDVRTWTSEERTVRVLA